MKQRDQRGQLNILVIPLILVSVLLVSAIGFAVWAFMGKQDYKNNTDQKISAANAVVKKQTQAEDAKLYAEKDKQPLATYTGPETYGSLVVQYPKTWSVYQASAADSKTGLDVIFNPNAVPSTSDTTATYALRAKVVAQSYETILKQYASNKNVTVVPYKLAKMDSLVGSRVEGQILSKKQGVMVIFQIRDKTLQVWTESSTYLPELDTLVLPNLTFAP